jgi:penicillin-binding protein 1B
VRFRGVRVNWGRGDRGFLPVGLVLGLLALLFAVFVVAIGIYTYYWFSFGRMIDQRLAGHVNQESARIYTAPTPIFTGEKLPESRLVEDLQRAGYSGSKGGTAPGWFTVQGNVVEVHPEQESYFAGKNALRVEFAANAIRRIWLLDDQSLPANAQIEPQLLTNLFGSEREKRRKVRFEDIPKVLVDAVLSAEDKRFFEHPGFDIVRILGAAWADLRHDAKAQGASTLTMQVARSFFFTTERTWRRKVAETLVSIELEHRFTKKEIFELYANEIYLGNRGSFAIHGFSEGALAYFNKDIHDLSLNEAAFLAGIIRAPNRYSTADRRPERADEARDRVLNQMAENRFITVQDARDAKRAPLHLVSGGIESSSAPYFVDMVKDHLLDHYSEAELLSQSFRVYTTLDPDLQHAASEAISIGVANVDKLLARRYAADRKKGQPAIAQVAMIVLDPHTGEIRAVIGGRDYGQSQLNHILARRQPGSVFKPFVYAAAFDNAAEDVMPIITPATTLEDEPTTFDFDGKEYTPNNYGENFHGTVTAREALTFSLNVATVKLAEMVGYGRVVQVARKLGLDDDIQATPAVALGAYDMTALEVAGGYTVFANGGVRADPLYIDRVVNATGGALERSAIHTQPVLDPRVAYQVTSILEDVLDRGTGASVRARGFKGPAAGKTGTSRDGWFAGYTSNLLAIVWVGFDDNRDLGVSGTASAAPIWAEFMKRATALPAYHDMQDFDAPEGITEVEIDPQTTQLAGPNCPVKRREVFITGTEPTELCEVHGGGTSQSGSWLSHLFGGGRAKSRDDSGDDAPHAATPEGSVGTGGAPRPGAKGASADDGTAPADAENKKGLMRRFFGIFGGSKPDSDEPKTKPPSQ